MIFGKDYNKKHILVMILASDYAIRVSGVPKRGEDGA